jgi:trehalose 6-phosphate phosphatase
MTPPDLDRTFALFLDVDGTLVEIAATPEAVVVAPGLPALLTELHRHLQGAVAIISGRPLSQIDSLLHPFAGSAAGEHGVAIRYGDGTLEEMPAGLAVPDDWREALTASATRWPGVRIESKPHGVTIHYRLAPEHGNDVWRVARALVGEGHPWFRLLPAREAVEIGLRAASKGQAVERLMRQAVFRGRKPVYVGDDFTDEAGISAARELGGIGLRVGEAFGGDPAHVRAWLKRSCDRLACGERADATVATGVSPS